MHFTFVDLLNVNLCKLTKRLKTENTVSNSMDMMFTDFEMSDLSLVFCLSCQFFIRILCTTTRVLLFVCFFCSFVA